MNESSVVTVIIPTYNRPEVLKQTVINVLRYIRHDNWIQILIGNDGDDELDIGAGYSNIKILPGPKRGLGANLNMLIQAADTDIVLQMDDDHHLVKPLDITQYVRDLYNPELNVDWIRLFLGTEGDLANDDPFYKFVAHMRERYWLLDPRGSEFYTASNRPHLKQTRFHSAFYGWYDEDKKLGETEAGMCSSYNSIQKDRLDNGPFPWPWVAVPVCMPSFDTWEHVGDSWQKEGY